MIWLAADGVGQSSRSNDWLGRIRLDSECWLLMPIAGVFQHLAQTLTSAERLNEVILAKPDVCFPEIDVKHDHPSNSKVFFNT